MTKSKKSELTTQVSQKMPKSATKRSKQVLTIIRQVLAKTTRVTHFAGKKVQGAGRLARKKWYYFAVVIIVFLSVIPFLPAKEYWSLVSWGELREEAGQAGELPVLVPVDRLELVGEEDLLATGGRPPLDLFSEQQVDRIAASSGQVAAGDHVAGQGGSNGSDPAPVAPQPAIRLSWPVSGQVTGQFGYGYSQAYNDYRFNPGINISGGSNVQVQAAAPGKVSQIGENLLHNNFVTLEHEEGLTTYYGNLGQIRVQAGERVETGTTLGTLGQPGYHSLGLESNLFFQLKQGETSLDPGKFLPAK